MTKGKLRELLILGQHTCSPQSRLQPAVVFQSINQSKLI